MTLPIPIAILLGIEAIVCTFGAILIYWRKIILARKGLCWFNPFNWTIPRENRLMKKLINETENAEEKAKYVRIQHLLTLTHIAFFSIFGLIAFVMYLISYD